MRNVKWLVCGVVVWAALAGVARADDPTATAIRTTVEAAGPAIVPLKVVLSFRQQERENELLGTVIDETGLIVTSNAAADPVSVGAALRPGSAIESEIKGVSLIRPDGTELALKVVLRDADLDLMFLRPEQQTDLAHLALPETGADPALGDRLILVGRLGAIGDRQPVVTAARVQAVIDKPRRFYITRPTDRTLPFGCPVFDGNGALVGFVTLRFTMQTNGAALLPVILPLADVLDDVAQVREDEAEEATELVVPEAPVPEDEPMEEGSTEGSASE